MTTQLLQLPTGSQHKRLPEVLFFQAAVKGRGELLKYDCTLRCCLAQGLLLLDRT